MARGAESGEPNYWTAHALQCDADVEVVQHVSCNEQVVRPDAIGREVELGIEREVVDPICHLKGSGHISGSTSLPIVHSWVMHGAILKIWPWQQHGRVATRAQSATHFYAPTRAGQVTVGDLGVGGGLDHHHRPDRLHIEHKNQSNAVR